MCHTLPHLAPKVYKQKQRSSGILDIWEDTSTLLSVLASAEGVTWRCSPSRKVFSQAIRCGVVLLVDKGLISSYYYTMSILVLFLTQVLCDIYFSMSQLQTCFIQSSTFSVSFSSLNILSCLNPPTMEA